MVAVERFVGASRNCGSLWRIDADANTNSNSNSNCNADSNSNANSDCNANADANPGTERGIAEQHARSAGYPDRG
jgi:hypothetical protein